MKALDLFSGAGGAALGLIRAGFDVVGFDIVEQPDYPGEFVLGDALALDANYVEGFDLVWASPPCQAFSTATRYMANIAGRKSRGLDAYPDLLPATRSLLAGAKMSVIENVPQAPMRADLTLTLWDFRNPAPVERKRIFETSFPLLRPVKARKPPGFAQIISLTGNSQLPDFNRRRKEMGLKSPTVEEVGEALGVFHVITGGKTARRRALNQMIPPEYSEFIGREALRQIREARL